MTELDFSYLFTVVSFGASGGFLIAFGAILFGLAIQRSLRFFRI